MSASLLDETIPAPPHEPGQRV